MSTGAAAILGILTGFVALILILCIAIYNKLVVLRNEAASSWSDIDKQLKKRYDLLPTFVETVKGYAANEQPVFEKASESRSRAMQTSSPAEKASAENALTDTLKSLFAVAGAYPELEANANFMELLNQLQRLDNDIEYARRYYNAVVRDFNGIIESFPSSIIASLFRFTRADFFKPDTPEADKENR